eukprot:TRINITY_DN3140_c0_g1_i1.p1 TRINITY_DN3140_c0_g1~~TRINITY_DN3140_c0_g1_i1.p1  ORF type:complete len:869 (-),score=169.44 TRINITY_DN3140_c0_g1_i1:72-2678(-)
MGSLFKSRDFWGVACGHNEEFDRKSLAVGNIDNDSTPSDKIITGSFSGILRIYLPKQKGYKPDDLLLEQNLDAPILQISVGRFLPNTPNLALAVLHPRKLTVLTVHRQGTGEGSADPLARQFTLTRQYEHNLERTAYNFCIGPFGGAHGKDYIAVQSMDGQISFYEQDRLTFQRFFPDFLVPGALAYCAKNDSFITHSSTWQIQCYKFRTLASSSEAETKASEPRPGEEDPRSRLPGYGKRLQVDWAVDVGEDVIDIRVAKFQKNSSEGQTDIIVLGERTLFCISDQGTVTMQKRLDYFSACVLPYVVRPDTKLNNIIVGTYNHSLQVFSDVNLVWAAKTQNVAVSLEIGTFAKTEGFIVMLTQDGQLSVNYLGTDPASNPVQILESKELDYEEMDEEHRRLQALIRQAVNAGKAEPKEQLVLRVQVPTIPDGTTSDHLQGDTGSAMAQHSVTIKLFMKFTGEDAVENVVVTVIAPPPFQYTGDLIIDRVQGTGGSKTATPLEVPWTFFIPDSSAAVLLPTSLHATIIAAYQSPSGEPLTAKTSFLLPLSLVGTVIPPVKNPAFKITLDTNRLPPQLQLVFDDVVAGKGELASAGNVLTFQYTTGADATILVSKNAGRYRIQSGSFEALWLLTAELVRRLDIYFSDAANQGQEGQEEPFRITYTENLPFQEYFAAIDAHFKARQNLMQSQQTLSERAHQFRSIQKRLLVRFKDRNPSPLANLDLLFEDTYRQLIAVSERVEADQLALARAANTLSCATSLMLLLIRYRFGMKKEDFKVLQNYLSPQVVDSQTQGWEECTDASMTHLLRTCLAKNIKEQSSMPQPLQVPSDTNKLKKHIALVCDRLAKGGSLAMAPAVPAGKKGQAAVQ